MDYTYTNYDGTPFPDPDSLFPSPQVVNLILMHGQEALDAMEQVDDEDWQQFIEEMIDAGLLEKDGEGKLRMTPKMLRGIEHKVMLEIFEGLRRGTREGHQTLDFGRSRERSDGTKPYEFGDPINELDVSATLRNTLARARSESPDEAVGLPLQIQGADIEIHRTDGQSDSAVCVLIDMSGSMMRWGRFFQAKRVAMGLTSMVRSKFPQDTIDFVGFYSLADPLREMDLPLVMPKPVSVHDPTVRMRMPLAEARENVERIPQHFTNLQLGLRQARAILSKRGAANKQIFVITDGQPTAHVEPSPADGSDMLYLLYPPEQRTADATLKEALTCVQQGMRIATFALVEDYWGMDWVHFVDQMTRLTRGTAFYCSSDDLASTVMESYLSGKRRKRVTG